MKTVFVMYMPGLAGNLINRLISLSPETVPQLSIKQLRAFKDRGQLPDFSDRRSLYSFHKATQFPSWQHFHRDCADFYTRKFFEYLNEHFEEQFSCLVYAIHPVEFDLMYNHIRNSDDPIYRYVSLSEKYRPWVEHYRPLLGFRDRENEAELHKRLEKEHNMQPIYLDQMLDSMSGFESEYLRIIQDLELTPEIELARDLFQEWLGLRGQCLDSR